MKLTKDMLVIATLGILCVSLYGCPLLMIGGLGYTGYQYHEKEGIFAPGQVLGGPAPADADKKSSDSNTAAAPTPTPSSNNIE